MHYTEADSEYTALAYLHNTMMLVIVEHKLSLQYSEAKQGNHVTLYNHSNLTYKHVSW